MTVRSSICAVFGLGAALLAPVAKAQTPAKVAVIDIQAAMVQTKDGQKAGTDMKTKFTPRQTELEKKKQEIDGLQDQLRKGQNTMNDDNRQKLMRDIDQKSTVFKRDGEDFNQDIQQEQQKIMGELYPKIVTVLNKYATEHGYAVVLDISGQQSPVLFAASSIEITRDIIDLYDKSSGFSAPQQPKAAPPPAAPKPATPKPVK